MATSTTAPRGQYHHGDLRAACLKAARELLEEEAELSLRAVARRASVSPAAPYRHYADKDALVSALAAQGCRELHDCLAAAAPAATSDDFAALAVAYVRFALAHPALFRIMFRTSCTPADTERDAAAADVDAFVRRAAARARPDADPDALGVACWALLHGLAFLYLEGKLPTDPPAAVDARVRTSVGALIDAGRRPGW
ncbi:TetR/AcrR family transcriptional regulator [Streptomyces collinus]|uniref:TetR/AcrR family transcriptional regulator n=1 Tax=Streptomyces collinus TaxID=42684 RepID=UPI0036ADA9BA